MHPHAALFLCLCIIFTVVQGIPIFNQHDDLTLALIDVADELDLVQLGQCSLDHATLPLSDTNPQLPPPSDGLVLKYVALGRGTQNYTCTGTNATAAPAAVGAIATLFDASCLALNTPGALHGLTHAWTEVPVNAMIFIAGLLGKLVSAANNGLVIGQHYFNGQGTPVFDLRLAGQGDWIAASKIAGVPAPTSSNQSSVIPWLKLGYKDGDGIKEVYRVETSGGSAPSTCEGQPQAFEVDYTAEYWFFG